MTRWPPGLTVSVVSREARPVTEIDTRALWPAASVPDDGATISLPSRLAGSAIDHETGPLRAVSVSVLPSSGVRTTVAGDTASVPWSDCGGVVVGGADEDAVDEGDADDDEEDEGPDGTGDGWPDGDVVADGDVGGTPPEDAATGIIVTPGAPPAPPRPGALPGGTDGASPGG